MAKIEVDIDLTFKEMELKAQALTSKNAVVDPPACNIDAKSLKLPASIDENDIWKLDSYLLRFECYAENAMGGKTCGLLSGMHFIQEESWT